MFYMPDLRLWLNSALPTSIQPLPTGLGFRLESPGYGWPSHLTICRIWQCRISPVSTPRSRKKCNAQFLVVTSANVDHFQNSFTDRFTSKLHMYLSQILPPHLNYVATLPWKIWGH